jgi:hypothetical protein
MRDKDSTTQDYFGSRTERNYNTCTSVLISLGVWLLVLSIVFPLLWNRANTKICDIRLDRDEAKEQLYDIVIPCCTNISANCTCSNIIDFSVSCWDADSNEPLLVPGVGNESDLFVTCDPGFTDLDGNIDWLFGDYARFTNGSWWKNDAQVPISPFGHEQYVIDLVPSGFSGAVPAVPTSYTVDLFILGEWIIMHFPFFEAVPGIRETICPPSTFCTYEPSTYVSSAPLPLNRLPDLARPFLIPNAGPDYSLMEPVWSDYRNCRDNVNVTDECQQCPGFTTNIITSSVFGEKYVELDSSGIIRFSESFRGQCALVYQSDILYKMIQV